MSKYVFLYRVKDTTDRDACAYLENKPMKFECNHYFGGFVLHGSCYCTHSWENYENVETILTEQEYNKLQQISAEYNKLSYGISPGDERYQKGLALAEEAASIFDKLNSAEAVEFYRHIVEDEKRIVMDECGMDEDEVEEAFSEYSLDYQDRSIIGEVYKDAEELGWEEAHRLHSMESGGIIERYFDFDKFGNDLVDYDENYHELSSGRCVAYNM